VFLLALAADGEALRVRETLRVLAFLFPVVVAMAERFSRLDGKYKHALPDERI
jgi:hypothetical protein